jgi:hypothetical protein
MSMVLAMVAAIAAVAMTARRLPLQNAVAAAAVIGLVAAAGEAVISATAYSVSQLTGGTAWAHAARPILWIAIMLGSRSVAQLVLQPWRNGLNPGIQTLLLAALLATILASSVELPAKSISRVWVWLVCAATAMLSLVAATPWLIDKRRTSDLPPANLWPLGIWIALALTIATSNAIRGQWPSAAVVFGGVAVVAFLSVRSIRLSPAPA